MVINNFTQRLDNIVKKNNSCVCVGLDSNFERIPLFLKKNKTKSEAILYFNQKIIDATHDLVCAYKPNIAFYEAEGIEGIKALKKTVSYIKKKHPEILIIGDAKRADIGSTNLGYVKAIFDYFNFDALTVHPYLGQEALQPFLERKEKGVFILCRTSNPGAGEFQDLIINHSKLGKIPLYKVVAHQVVKFWNKNKNCVLVVGATYPKELAEIRKIAGDMPFLIPGIGAQGGDVKKTVRAGKNRFGKGIIINSSRSIIFASPEKDFAQKAAEKTKELRNNINRFL